MSEGYSLSVWIKTSLRWAISVCNWPSCMGVGWAPHAYTYLVANSNATPIKPVFYNRAYKALKIGDDRKCNLARLIARSETYRKWMGQCGLDSATTIIVGFLQLLPKRKAIQLATRSIPFISWPLECRPLKSCIADRENSSGLVEIDMSTLRTHEFSLQGRNQWLILVYVFWNVQNHK